MTTEVVEIRVHNAAARLLFSKKKKKEKEIYLPRTITI